MNLSQRQLEYLLALNRHRHYGHAAEHLGISQPALSRSVMTIEKHLGAPLFERSPTGVRPTRAGRRVLEHAIRVTALSAELSDDLAEIGGRGSRSLSVVCGHYPAELTVPLSLSRLMQQEPGIQVAMEVADWSRGIQLLEEQVCELAIIELSARSLALSLDRESLSNQRVYPVVRKGHPLTQADPPTLEGLLSYPWATSRIPARLADYFGEASAAAGEFDPGSGIFTPRIVASSLSTSLKLVCKSDFVGIAPLSVADPLLQSGELELVRLSVDWMRLHYGFVWESNRPPKRLARQFMSLMREAEAAERERDGKLRAEYGLQDAD